MIVIFLFLNLSEIYICTIFHVHYFIGLAKMFIQVYV